MGECHFDGEMCVASEISCKTSLQCRTRGHCSLDGVGCFARRKADCARSVGCQTVGRCALEDGQCWPMTDEHFAQSEVCLTEGRCAMGLVNKESPNFDELCVSRGKSSKMSPH